MYITELSWSAISLLMLTVLFLLEMLRALNPFFGVVNALDEKSELWVSNHIFDELKGFSRPEITIISQNVKLETILINSINKIRKKTKTNNPPQISDLSLLVINQKYPENDWTLITDDFKLAQAAQTIYPSQEVWPPRIFILYLSRNVDSPHLSNQLRDIWQKVMAQN